MCDEMRVLLALLILLLSAPVAIAESVDLEVTNLSVSEPVIYGESATITAKVNVSLFQQDFEDSTIPVIYNTTFYKKAGTDTDYVEIGTVEKLIILPPTFGDETIEIGGIPYTRIAEIEHAVSLSWTPDSTGDVSFKAVVDPEDDITELLEGNNEKSIEKEIVYDDIALTDVSFSSEEGEVWEEQEVTATISRSGTANRSISYLVAFYEDVGEDYVAFDLVRVSDHPQGETIPVTGTWVPEKYGGRTVKVEVDSEDEIGETNDGNNILSAHQIVQTTLTVLSPDSEITVDENGFAEIDAVAGYYGDDDEFYCYDTTVEATVDDITYSLKRYYNCRFSKLVQLPVGDYSAMYRADYPGDYPDRTESSMLTVTSTTAPTLVVYGVDNDTAYAVDNPIDLEIVGVQFGYNLRGANVVVTLFEDDKHTVVESKTAPEDALGVYKATITPDYEDTFFVRVGMTYLHWYLEQEFEIRAVPPGAVPGRPMQDLAITVISPEENYTYNLGYNLPIQAQVVDFTGILVTDADVSADIYDADDDRVENFTLEKARYYYKSNYTFDTAGTYEMKFTAKHEGKTAVAWANFSIGTAEEITAAEDFTVRIITPVSDVYLENSILYIRAKVTKENESMREAYVSARLGDRRYNLTYERYGEYVATTDSLPEGEYEVRVTAVEGDYIAEDSVAFMMSKHKIIASILEPRTDVDAIEGDSLPIRVEVVDETGDVVEGVTVIAEILEPTGRQLETQIFLDMNGEYSTVFYPNEEGFYQITVTSSKLGLVSSIVESGFTVTFQKDEILFKTDFETLFTIVVGVLVIILLIAILRAVF